MKTPKNKQNSLKRVFALLSTICILFALVGALSVGVSATSFMLDVGFEVVNYDEMGVIDSEPSGVEIELPNETLLGYNVSGVEIHIFAKYRDETSTSAKWVLRSNDGRDVPMIPKNVVEGGVMPLSSGEWGIYKFTLDGLLPSLLDGFTILNYYDQNLQEDAISPVDVAFVVFVSTYRVDRQYVDTIEQRVLDVLNSSTTKSNANELFLFFENGYTSGYNDGSAEGYDEGYDDGKDIGYDEGYDDGKDIGYDEGYDDGKDIGYDEGYVDGSDGIGIEKLPFAVTDSIANMFVTITNFEILGINILGLLGSIISICVVAFVIKKVF